MTPDQHKRRQEISLALQTQDPCPVVWADDELRALGMTARESANFIGYAVTIRVDPAFPKPTWQPA